MCQEPCKNPQWHLHLRGHRALHSCGENHLALQPPKAHETHQTFTQTMYTLCCLSFVSRFSPQLASPPPSLPPSVRPSLCLCLCLFLLSLYSLLSLLVSSSPRASPLVFLSSRFSLLALLSFFHDFTVIFAYTQSASLNPRPVLIRVSCFVCDSFLSVLSFILSSPLLCSSLLFSSLLPPPIFLVLQCLVWLVWGPVGGSLRWTSVMCLTCNV